MNRIVLSAGGAKVGSYLGIYRAFCDTKLIESVDEISGSSAGAIAACLMSIGVDSSIMYDTIKNLDFENMLGSIVMIDTPPYLSRDGNPMKLFLRETILKCITDYLVKRDNVEVFKDILLELQQCKKITFGQLKRLRKVDPVRFKSLIVSATCVNDHKTYVFNFDTPDVEIVKAVVASSSIPVILKPSKITVNDDIKTFTDGGLLDYVPVDKFDIDYNGNYYNMCTEKTVVIIFSDNKDKRYCSAARTFSNAYSKEELYEPGFALKFIRDYGPHLLLGPMDKHHSHSRNEILEDIKTRYKDNTLIIYNHDVEEFEFYKTTKYLEEMSAFAYIDTMNFITQKCLIPTLTFDFNILFSLYNGTLKILGHLDYCNKYHSYQDLLNNYIVFGTVESKVLSLATKFIIDNNYGDFIFDIYLLSLEQERNFSVSKFLNKVVNFISEWKTAIDDLDQNKKLLLIKTKSTGNFIVIRDSIHELLKSLYPLKTSLGQVPHGVLKRHDP
jgi:hypothetical protein